MKNKEFYKYGLETMAEKDEILAVDKNTGFPTRCSLLQACRHCLFNGDCSARRKKWLDAEHMPLSNTIFYFDNLTDEEKGFIEALQYKGGYFYKGLSDLVDFNYIKPKYATLEVWSSDHPDGDISLKKGLFSFVDMNTCWEYNAYDKKFIKVENK